MQKEGRGARVRPGGGRRSLWPVEQRDQGLKVYSDIAFQMSSPRYLVWPVRVPRLVGCACRPTPWLSVGKAPESRC